ncbi:hypothetical protein CL617_05120 [archaeon]|nr:hypothetical protein [archaeon]|tara:strand:- start:1828 stop:2337 length:510 start_codon:yes stop_codon:yes gene_type:complete
MVRIEKDEFILRDLEIKDSQGYWETMQDEKTKEGMMETPKSFKRAKIEVEDYIEDAKTKVKEVLTIEIDGQYAGNVRLDYQGFNTDSDEGRVHMWIHPKFRKNKLAQRALQALIKYAFEKRKFRVLYGQSKVSNKAMAKIMENLGFEKEKKHRIVDDIKKIWWTLKKQV